MPLTITTQPEITYGVSPPYYAPFQHMTRSNPTILFPNTSEFSTPLNIGGTSQTPMTYNLPPLAREQIIQNLNAQLQFIQQQISLFSQVPNEALATGTSTPRTVPAIGLVNENRLPMHVE